MSWLSGVWQNADKVSLEFVDKDGTKSYIIDLSRNWLSSTMNGQIQDFFHYGSIEDKKQILKLYANKINLTDIFINFLAYLPWWAYRSMPIIQKSLDIPIKKKDEEHCKRLLESWKSDLYIHGTLNDFFTNIDQWIQEENLDVEKIIALQDKWWYISNLSQKLYEYVRPLYIRMLKKWYSHNDCVF